MWSARTRCREPTRAYGPVRWKGATGPPGCPSPLDSVPCAPGEQPDKSKHANEEINQAAAIGKHTRERFFKALKHAAYGCRD